jgi:hypothetical protein
MSRFGMITEDPFYDEDGVLIDEDFDPDEYAEAFPEPTEAEINQMLQEISGEKPEACYTMDCDPFNTINS